MPLKLTDLNTGGGCGCKVSPNLLHSILKNLQINKNNNNVIVSHTSMDDAAVFKTGTNTNIVVTTDFFTPIVDDPFDYGRIAATNAISDIYAMGATPNFALCILGMPIKKLSTQIISKVLNGGYSVCNSIGIPILGGHSIDITDPVYGLVVIGTAKSNVLKKNSNAKAEDNLLITKPLGVGILASNLKKNNFKKNILYKKFLDIVLQMNHVGEQLAKKNLVNSMTDVTGFGLLGHLLEVCKASNLTAEIEFDKIPFIQESIDASKNKVSTGASKRNWNSYSKFIQATTMKIWQRNLLTDPQTSGGLLITFTDKNKDKVFRVLKNSKIKSLFTFGKLKKGSPSIKII